MLAENESAKTANLPYSISMATPESKTRVITEMGIGFST